MQTVPASTYRLQLHRGFTFDDAAKAAEYLRALGVSHVYSSPYLQAAPGSMHGYDVVDHRFTNIELGGGAAHDRFCQRLGELGLGQVLDIVPNHMSLGEQNRYWWDVLENGRSSRYAAYFDIDWDSFEPRLRDTVLVPTLPDHYGRVLSAGGIVLKRELSAFLVSVGEQSLPLSPQGVGLVLARAAASARNDDLAFLAASFGRQPALDIYDRRRILARDREKKVLAGFLDRICTESREVCETIDRTVKELNADADALDEVLSVQNYRLAYWKTADQQLGYRRFFNVNTLIGLRVEREYVFEETHSLIAKWLADGAVDGVRVDHPDGLRDPLQYFKRLREVAPKAWIIGEKILEGGEELRRDWPVQGTTGYEFLNLALGLLVLPEGLRRLGEHYAAFTGETETFAEVAHAAKVDVTAESLGSDVNRLTSIFVDICESHRDQRDFARNDIRSAIGEFAACFPVYRTYVVPETNSIAKADKRYIQQATKLAKANRKDIEPMLFDFMQNVLQLEVVGEKETEFVYRFQQFTSPVMAKGVEDCAFYRYNRLVAMNEVGGDPASGGVALEDFHRRELHVQKHFPATMVTLSTHDTKRSDDVRARLAVLTEAPDVFAESAERWSAMAAVDRPPEIDRGTEWFLYQTLVGAWPIPLDRLSPYMQKAMREAKLKTNWMDNNTVYEDALHSYIERLLLDSRFVADIESFVDKVRFAGFCNSVSQTLLKYTVPGVPDLYQGSELWDLSLVDPDNRRPVDFERRCDLLRQMEKMNIEQVMGRMEEGLPKLWTIAKCLGLRRSHPEWFNEGASYAPLLANGDMAGRVVAFLRADNVATIAPRWFYRADGWADTTLQLPEGRWVDCLTAHETDGGTVRLESLLRAFPVALLVRKDAINASELRNA